MRKEFLFILSGVFLITSACKKVQSPDLDFKSAAVKEWYFGTFKKSAEYGSYDSKLRGKKSPDWKNGIYKKIGSIETLEFPLIRIKPSISIPSNTSLTDAQNKRIAEASLARIVFFKTSNNNIVIRELIYVPEWKYLQRKGFDISHNSITRLDKDFSGRLIIKKWGGDIISFKILTEGKFTGSVNARRSFIGANPSLEEKSSANDGMECQNYLITEYEQICTEYWQGDQLIREECSSWELTGNDWVETVCNETFECDPNLSSDECACQLFAICGEGGDGSGEENCNLPDMNTLFANSGPVSIDIESNTEAETTSSTGDITRKWRSRWYFYRGRLLNYTWYYISLDRGVHRKYGNLWKWESITHAGEQTEGTTPFTTTLTMHADTTISADRSRATIELDYEVEMCVICKGLPFGCPTATGYNSREWDCN